MECIPSQVVVGEDGGCGSILEHSAGDGPAAIASNIFVMDLLDGSVGPISNVKIECIAVKATYLAVVQEEV